ncbi:regulatory protein (plasmid) [Streptantibioticus cattleyicolor NRRL 8057 = DSM 46488]|uniref:protein-serine/threonine phosphatase n=1 Tax=Streptantibioticus cattleyicolor (strain ATCC 35852 / DSM 46488 / JCM 4925 / NBRC 14057 / NRRL 8057) TaxID=1003195 RepID=G8XF26_STREN|nr:regulatory protein [Streptantibioticus cattleyicolor NRRL 8057 = DSM 46488]
MRSVLDGVAPDVVDTAELLTDELMTNAVVHARTEIEMRAWSTGGRVHVRVSDRRPSCGLVPHEHRPYATTGRGLGVVEQLASSHGAHICEDRKTVWFELWPGLPAPPASAWETVPPPGPTVTVTLVDVPYVLYWAAQQHWEALLREMLLVASAGERIGSVPPEELFLAHDTANVISACMTAAAQEETAGSATLSFLVEFPADAAPAVATLCRVLDAAEEAAQLGSVLTLPALPHIRAFRHWLLDQIAEQVAGGPPTSWALAGDAPVATATELSPWDASDIEAASVPTIVADDGDRIIAVNTAVASLLGWQADDLIGRPLTVLVPEHLRERHTAAFSSLLLTGQPRILGRSVPLPALHRDGRLIPIRLHIQTQEAVDGRTVLVAQLTPRTAAPEASSAPVERRVAVRAEPRPGSRPVRPPSGTTQPRRMSRDEMGDALHRLSLLAETGNALAGTLDLDEGLRRVCQVLTRRLADWCAVDLLDEQGDVNRVCVVHRDPSALTPGVELGTLPPLSEAERGPLPRVLRGAGPLLLTDIPPPGPDHSPLDTRQLELFQRLGASSAVIAPLRARREVLGALIVVRTREEDPFTEEDLPLVSDLVRGISLGVDNARLYQSTQRTAERLQFSLLPQLPDVAHLEMAARYAPSSTTAQVGGDWFDAFVLPNGDTAVVIGDVAGHDLQAAVAMSQLRNMLRGIAVDCQEPSGVVLHRLDRACHAFYPNATATCVYALVKGGDAGPWELHHASAGHLPMLLTTWEGETRYLESGAGLLIGMDPGAPRTTARDPLPPRSTLLLFTDGLIERRGESLDDAMARLRHDAATLARSPLDVFCDELIIRLGSDSTDDIALLAVRPAPPGRTGQ